MKKVLHMISSNGFYGAENVLLEICKGLQSSSQYYPVVALLNSGNKGHLPLLRECQKHELEYREFNCQGRFNRLVISELRKFIENNNIQIIHAHGYKSNFYASFARQPGQLLVSTCHNWIASGFKMRCFTWLDKFLLRRFDRIICVSKPVQLELKKWGVKAKNIFVVYNGVNIAKFRKNKESGNQIRRHLGVNDLDMVIGFVGRLSKEKGVHIRVGCGRRSFTIALPHDRVGKEREFPNQQPVPDFLRNQRGCPETLSHAAPSDDQRTIQPQCLHM